MTIDRYAMQQALEYISWYAFGECRIGIGQIPAPADVVAALRQALAATPAQPLSDAQASMIWPIAQDKWNAKADGYNQWDSLGRDEMSLLICREAEAVHGIKGEVKA